MARTRKGKQKPAAASTHELELVKQFASDAIATLNSRVEELARLFREKLRVDRRMQPLVARLRYLEAKSGSTDHRDGFRDAADEIERLEEMVEDLQAKERRRP